MDENDINSKFNLENFKTFLPKRIVKLLSNRDGVAELINALPNEYSLDDIAYDPDGLEKTEQHRMWELIGVSLLHEGRVYESIQVFSSLYRYLLTAQSALNKRLHKGVPLVWIHECYKRLHYPVHAKRYLMLTFCEDVITSKGKIDPNNSGVYFRLVWLSGLPNKEFNRYQDIIYAKYNKSSIYCPYPEWILQDLDNDWMIEIPSLQEAQHYITNTEYINHLYKSFGSGSGDELERVADYVLSCVAGCRTMRRAKSYSTDYDVVCSLDGIDIDFRSEFGRYFICECKDWERTASFSTIAKFCRVLDSVKCKFGLLFSKNGISGQEAAEEPRFAYREILKIYQDRGLAIIVIDNDDINKIIDGYNFTVMLRSKYDEIRLDLKNQLFM
jgi:hypothetical protein